jgi:hypothetical protein
MAEDLKLAKKPFEETEHYEMLVILMRVVNIGMVWLILVAAFLLTLAHPSVQ